MEKSIGQQTRLKSNGTNFSSEEYGQNVLKQYITKLSSLFFIFIIIYYFLAIASPRGNYSIKKMI